ncbi:calcium-translocating P-type ATPase, PMCA-type [Parabacteroides bouchesdurhonensis]|uniref:calcium-translocating P-type ATPase, PMCA-type n=1 Tax=Parabacteroides bouchesdurhonensis TaxID=1936995 RepID=UPI000E4688E3|nr:calcium-translocating P-type ATPase, PMCA-type [Parabacteroides bouchesdurhonensis]RHJ93507.1 calcium-translocating P-type ATPase, PMCA-type [Bacteroides sp. AM07-16]
MEKKHQYQGLTKQEVEESRRIHGENILTPPQKTSLWKLFFEKFDDPIIKILLVAWLLSMIIAGVHCWGPEAKGFTAFFEPIGIFFAIMLASCVGFAFEVKANKAFDILNTVNDDTLVKVIRDGNICQVPKKEVVVGDIVVLETGEEVPADGHLIEAISLQINESTLTGEPIISKTTNEADFDTEATYPSNVVMRGTTVVDGHGIMQVEKVGDATGYGKVYEGSQIESGVETPLQVQLAGLAKVISKAGYSIAALTFIALLVKLLLSSSGMPIMDLIAHILNIFMVAVTLIVVSVPEGLPMSVTLSLALSMNRMLKTNNLVRKMHACETMGATTVICTDKTGTLTQNQMQVHETKFYNLKDQRLEDDELSNLIKEGISVNSTAYLDFSEDKVKTLGNPTEAALLLWLNGQHQNYLELRENAKILDQLTFSTERKYMATIVQSPLLGKKVLYVKGAPEIVLANSQRVAIDGTYKPVEACKAEIEKQLLDYQNQAMRTLGFACQIFEEGQDITSFVNGKLHAADLTYLGIVAISDPVRADVPAAVQSCLDAGIDIKIVTGDTPGTAKEIGRQIGIWKPNDTDLNIITGPGFEALSDEDALNRVLNLKIMCRARPTDKQRLVQLLQQKEAVVAVTGDGTNDAPALKAAQVGLSMGDGTSVAKEASDITILDNSFSSITRAVMWGRSLYRNIQKFLLFQLTINVAACLIVLLGSLLGTESPLTITQMLWVNLIMDTFAAGALASLPPNERVMKDKPRRNGKNGDFIITRPMAYNIFGVGIFFVIILMGLLLYFHAEDGLTPHDLSWFFSFFVMLQFWNMFNAKAFMEGRSAFANLGNSKSFLLVALIILIGQYLIVTFGGEMFNVIPLSWKDWGIIIGSSSFVLWIGELARFIGRFRSAHK